MKHFKLLSFLLLVTLAGRSQSMPCPDVQRDTLALVSTLSGGINCTVKVQVFATGDVGSDKPMRLIVFNGPVPGPDTLINECFMIPGKTPSTLYESSTFTLVCKESYAYQIIMYTASTVNRECGTGATCIINRSRPAEGLLPIKLSNFYGNRKGNSVQLEWTSAQESNASYYGIERNTGAGFSNINKVNATNSLFGSKYSFEDPITSKSAVLYRLRLVDKDGSFTLSNVVSIKGVSSVSNVDIYPNPAVVGNTKIKISDITDITSVQVYDLSGKIIKNITVKNNDINMNDLQAGSYLLKMINAKTGGSATKRFMIMN